MINILCVEDSLEYQLLIKSSLEEFNVVFTGSLKEATLQLENRANVFDLILLDLSLPDGSGFKLLSDYYDRPITTKTPIFVLTVEPQVSSKITAFQIGADDYICKPFSPGELRARVERKLRYMSQLRESQNKLTFANLVLDTENMRVFVRKTGLQLGDFTPIEFRLLFSLCKNAEIFLNRQKLIQLAWGEEVNVTDRTVDAHISHVRKKIENSSVRIETEVGSGYKITAN